MTRAAPPGDDGAGPDGGLPAPSGAGGDLSGGREPLVQVRMDGKTVRGAKGANGSQVHLPVTMAGDGEWSPRPGSARKTNEIPMIIPLLHDLDLAGAVITADALHCQRATADHLHHRGADFVLPVKENQPGPFGALDALPWRDVPVTHTATDRGHAPAPSRSCPHQMTCHYRTSARFISSSATSPTASCCRPSPRSASPA